VLRGHLRLERLDLGPQLLRAPRAVPRPPELRLQLADLRLGPLLRELGEELGGGFLELQEALPGLVLGAEERVEAPEGGAGALGLEEAAEGRLGVPGRRDAAAALEAQEELVVLLDELLAVPADAVQEEVPGLLVHVLGRAEEVDLVVLHGVDEHRLLGVPGEDELLAEPEQLLVVVAAAAAEHGRRQLHLGELPLAERLQRGHPLQ